MDARAILVTGVAAAAVGLGAAVGSGVEPAAARNVDYRGAVASRPQPLHLGSHSPRVRALEVRLAALGYLPPGGADAFFGTRTWHAVVAFQGWQRLHRDGVVGARTRAALATATRPRPWGHLKRGLELDLQRQVLLVVADGRTLRAVHISSAAPGYVTPRGRYRVYRREHPSWSSPYRVWMPNALYFSGGYAIHGFNSVPAYPASHGCVRMPLSEAPFVYTKTPPRTPVVIR